METVTHTDAPRAWQGQDLYDWGRNGLRAHGNQFIPTDGRPRKTFDTRWLGAEPVTLQRGVDTQAIRRARRAAPGEVWRVFVRVGRYWTPSRYLTSSSVLRLVEGGAA